MRRFIKELIKKKLGLNDPKLREWGKYFPEGSSIKIKYNEMIPSYSIFEIKWIRLEAKFDSPETQFPIANCSSDNKIVRFYYPPTYLRYKINKQSFFQKVAGLEALRNLNPRSSQSKVEKLPKVVKFTPAKLIELNRRFEEIDEIELRDPNFQTKNIKLGKCIGCKKEDLPKFHRRLKECDTAIGLAKEEYENLFNQYKSNKTRRTKIYVNYHNYNQAYLKRPAIGKIIRLSPEEANAGKCPWHSSEFQKVPYIARKRILLISCQILLAKSAENE